MPEAPPRAEFLQKRLISAFFGIKSVTQPKGDPKILKREPNFEQKGDPNYVKGDLKGGPKFFLLQNSSQRANLLK